MKYKYHLDRNRKIKLKFKIILLLFAAVSFLNGKELLAQEESLSLPFFDDFSYYQTSSEPDPDLWFFEFIVPAPQYNNDDIFINDDLAWEPPTPGVATFDQIDKHGMKANEDFGIGGTGIEIETLTSRQIDLSPPHDGMVYLSFYVQPKGDQYHIFNNPKLRISFYECSPTGSGEITCSWEEVELFELQWPNQYDPDDPSDFLHGSFTQVHDFRFYKIAVSEERFLHESFRFRFSYVGSQNASRTDIWNVDNVKLDVYDGTLPEDECNDISFSECRTSNLYPYSVMPWKHFLVGGEDFWQAESNVKIRNLSNQEAKIQYPEINITDDNGNDIYSAFFGDINNQTFSPNALNNFAHNIPFASLNLPAEPPNEFITTYTFNDFLSGSNVENNTIQRVTRFDDKLAYDDGTMEGHIAVNNQLAVRYRSPIATTLYGVEFDVALEWHRYVAEQPPGRVFWIEIYKQDPENTAELKPAATHIFRSTELYGRRRGNKVVIPFLDSDGSFYPIDLEPNEDVYIAIVSDNTSSAGNFLYGKKYLCLIETCDWRKTPLIGFDRSRVLSERVYERQWSYGTWNEVDFDDFPGVPMIRALLSEDLVRSELNQQIAVALNVSDLEICLGDDLTIDPRIFLLDDNCTENTILVDILTDSEDSNHTLSFDEAIGGYKFVNPYLLNAPTEAGNFQITLKAFNGCGIGIATVNVNVLPSTTFISNRFVCNNYPADNFVSIADNVYPGDIVKSGGPYCVLGAEVPAGGDVSFYANDEIRLFSGFHAANGSHFLARIGESDYQCIKEDDGLVSDSPAEEEKVMAVRQNSKANSDQVKVYPNPARDEVWISYTIPDHTKSLEIRLVDMLGKQLGAPIREFYPIPGAHQKQLFMGQWPDGIYLIEIVIGEDRQLHKIIKTH